MNPSRRRRRSCSGQQILLLHHRPCSSTIGRHHQSSAALLHHPAAMADLCCSLSKSPVQSNRSVATSFLHNEQIATFRHTKSEFNHPISPFSNPKSDLPFAGIHGCPSNSLLYHCCSSTMLSNAATISPSTFFCFGLSPPSGSALLQPALNPTPQPHLRRDLQQIGYRHIDCAPIYGNEKEIGEALKKLFEEGVVKREDLWITSKLWNAEQAPEDVPPALEQTLLDLQLDYVDLYLIHGPVRMKKGVPVNTPGSLLQTDIPATWRAMEALYDSGKARAIGVSNFSSKKLGDVLDIARVPPAVNQVECHPIWQQTKLRDLCKSKGVHLSAWSPLGSPGTVWIAGNVLKHTVVTSVAEKLGKTPAQVALRWGLHVGNDVLPKSTNNARIKENFDVFDWSIPDDLMIKFSEIEQERLVKGEHFISENGPYKSAEELWDGEV